MIKIGICASIWERHGDSPVFPRHRLTKYHDYDDDPNGTRKMLQYTYDAAGRVSMMTDYEGFDTVYRYTDAGQVAAITAAGSKVWDYEYNLLGQPTKVTLPNGMTTNYSYDGANRMTKLEHKDGATVKLGFTYGLTAGGQITRITHQDSAYWSYGNDGRGRLTKAERYNPSSVLQLKETYSYDAGDNLLTKVQYNQRPSPAVTKNTWYRYNAGNELTKMTAAGVDTNMTYDDWGRLVTKTQGAYTAAYLWRYGDKLKGVTTNFPGETTTAYLLDALGKRRVRIVQPDPNNSATWVVTAYRWDAGWNVIGEYGQGTDSTSNWDIGARNKTLVHRGMATLAEIDGANPSTGATRYYAHDHLGSARALYSSAKAEVGTLEFNPYGDTYASTGTQPAYSFTGKSYDSSIGMFYFPFRYYSPEMDRWITRDPLGMVDGPNLYGYVLNTPIALLDEHGLSVMDELEDIGRCLQGWPKRNSEGGCSSFADRTGWWPSGATLPQFLPKPLVDLGAWLMDWPRVRGGGSILTTWPSVLRTYPPWSPLRGSIWLRRISKASPWLTVIDGAISWGRIASCM